ncbi:MAG: hypothetical protein O3A51_00175 [Verrucomicrobia bacterium]|nr:hypothetical protein [Verrucomicrobiota bacterium]
MIRAAAFRLPIADGWSTVAPERKPVPANPATRLFAMNHDLSPTEEVAWLRELTSDAHNRAMLERVTHAFDVLHGRSSLLLSLITICLTITGFSGPSIAAAGFVPKIGLCVGMTSVFLAAVCLVFGPFQLRWATARKLDDIDTSLARLVTIRNHRTRLYKAASGFLVAGLFCYLLAVVVFMLEL